MTRVEAYFSTITVIDDYSSASGGAHRFIIPTNGVLRAVSVISTQLATQAPIYVSAAFVGPKITDDNDNFVISLFADWMCVHIGDSRSVNGLSWTGRLPCATAYFEGNKMSVGGSGTLEVFVQNNTESDANLTVSYLVEFDE